MVARTGDQLLSIGNITALVTAVVPKVVKRKLYQGIHMSKHEDNEIDYFTDEHLEWLVKSRIRNQKSAVDLHMLINKYEEKIMDIANIENIILELIAVNFSLWRAVFLSDVYEGGEHVLRDARRFLKNLIANNVVAYPQDRGAREWTFTYYMQNAQTRLENLSNNAPNALPKDEFLDTPSADDKLWWNECQTSFDHAVARVKRRLEK